MDAFSTVHVNSGECKRRMRKGRAVVGGGNGRGRW